MSTDEVVHLQGTLKPGHVVLPEFSVTATENVVLAAALLPGETTIEIAAAEPHVQAVERMVQRMGAEVEGIGTHTVKVRGKKDLSCIAETVVPDYLEAGVFILAALLTGRQMPLPLICPQPL